MYSLNDTVCSADDVPTRWCAEHQVGDFILVYTQNNVDNMIRMLYRALDMMMSFLKILEMAADIRLI